MSHEQDKSSFFKHGVVITEKDYTSNRPVPKRYCDICDKNIYASAFPGHVNRYHTDPTRNTPCPDCGELYTAQGLSVHISFKHRSKKK